MPTVSRVHSVRLLLKPLAAALVALPLLASAQPSKPTLSGPSVVSSAKQVEFSGRGFAPNSAVSVSIARAGGAEAHFSAVVGADGSLSYKPTVGAAGPHVLKVLDSSGKVLATANFMAH